MLKFEGEARGIRGLLGKVVTYVRDPSTRTLFVMLTYISSGFVFWMPVSCID